MSTVPEDTAGSYREESDAIQRFFNRPLFLSLTIGIPFVVYKFLFGITLIRFGAGLPFPADLAGWIVTGWSLADLGMNVGRQLYDIRHRPAPFEYCTIAQIGRFFSMPMVFLAVDTFLSFAIICAMLWSGWIAMLSRVEGAFWNAATTLNLISLSLVVLYNEIRTLR